MSTSPEEEPPPPARAYALAVVVEPRDRMWHAWCPTLLDYGAATWGATREEALGHLREMAGMLVRRLAEADAPVPEAPETSTPPGRGAAGERVVLAVRVPPSRAET